MDIKELKYDISVIHCRHQVLHSDYIRYLLVDKILCIYLVVWIITPDP